MSNCKCKVTEQVYDLEQEVGDLRYQFKNLQSQWEAFIYDGEKEATTTTEAEIAYVMDFEEDLGTSYWFSIGFSAENYDRIEKIAAKRGIDVNNFCSAAVLEIVEIIETVSEQEAKQADPLEQFADWVDQQERNALANNDITEAKTYTRIAEWIDYLKEQPK